MLVVGAFFGRAGGLIALGLVATLGLVGATVADQVDADKVVDRPATAAEVHPSYSMRVGEHSIDLSEVADPENLDGRRIDVEGAVGSIDILLPDDVRAVVDARVTGFGGIKLFGDDRDGIDVQARQTVGPPDAPTLTLDIELSVGVIEVTTR